jgi:hypothetical protein
MRRAGLIAALMISLLCLPGCKLVNQTTFGAQPARPAPDQLSLALQAGSGMPLVVIRDDGTAGLTATSLREAVDMAETRKPGARYDITTVVPVSRSFDQQISAVEQGRQQAADVMSTLADLGVAPERMQLLAHADPALTRREIRIYVH